METTADQDLLQSLRRLGLLGEGTTPHCEPLAGGVSADIWRVDLEGGPVCVKRALPRLKVASDWRAPVERGTYEARWMQLVGAISPESVPRLLGRDPEAGLFVMEFLDPSRFPLWKAELSRGRVDPNFAALVGSRIGWIHASTAGNPETASRFATDSIFQALRLEPYLRTTAVAHPDRACQLEELASLTARTRLALVHGDVSPKNLLVGPEGPVFLDSECAWYGDPAFDLAFCLNHLLLKCLLVRSATQKLLACFDVLVQSYLAEVTWEPRPELEARAAHLLPGLLLARVDGKSPVEYLTERSQRNLVRRVARALLAEPVDELVSVRRSWTRELGT